MSIEKAFRLIVAVFLMSSAPLVSVAAESQGLVLITGANRGIGLALAERFGRAGYEVIGTARRPEEATALRELGARIEQLDVTSQASVDALVRRLQDRPIDILINNAGIVGHDAANLDELEVDKLDTVFDVNTLGPLRVIQALLPNLRRSDTPVIANISSMMGSMEMTWGCCIGYRASKAALNSMTTTLAADFGKQDLIFVALHPGYVKTDMNEGRGNYTAKQSASGLFEVISGLDSSDNGKFYDFQGKELPW